jgi:hypothetical protein
MIMKRVFVTGMVLALGIMLVSGISPYIRVAEYDGPMEDVIGQVKTVLEASGYDIIGQYRPGDNPGLSVLVFTNDDLIALSQRSDDRGMLAAAMKAGFQKTDGKITVSFLNPEYLFYAYFREQMQTPSFKSSALGIASEVKRVMKSTGTKSESFGGDLTPKKLVKYRYMAGMPDFDKAVSLAEFDNFNQGLAAIRKGLSRSGSTIKVYEIVSDNSETAVFGIGLKDKEEGEAHFLPIIGESHVAAMPYEIILQGNRVTMLHGRYRFALHWPELTMKTFTKIMSSPGDVEDAMSSLFETD